MKQLKNFVLNIGLFTFVGVSFSQKNDVKTDSLQSEIKLSVKIQTELKNQTDIYKNLNFEITRPTLSAEAEEAKRNKGKESKVLSTSKTEINFQEISIEEENLKRPSLNYK